MRGVNITRSLLLSWRWPLTFSELMNCNKKSQEYDEYTVEQLSDKIKDGKTAIVAISGTIQRENLKALLDNKFKIIAISVKDFRELRNYRMS